MRLTNSRWPLLAVGLVSLIGLSACSEPQKVEAPAVLAPMPPSLYERVGGKTALTAVVDDFVVNVAKDKRVNRMLKKHNVAQTKMELVEQLCQGSGGPCQYTPKTMADASKVPPMSDAAATALTQDMQMSLAKFKVAEKEQTELLAVFDPIKGQVLLPPAPHMAHAAPKHTTHAHHSAAKPAPAAKK
jgi:hemoglobin